MERPLEVEDRCRRDQKGSKLVGEKAIGDKGSVGGDKSSKILESGLKSEPVVNPFLSMHSENKKPLIGAFQFKANTESKDGQSKKLDNVVQAGLNQESNANPFLSKPSENKKVLAGAFQFKANTEPKIDQRSQESEKLENVFETGLNQEPKANPLLSKPPESKHNTSSAFQFKANTEKSDDQHLQEGKKLENIFEIDLSKEAKVSPLKDDIKSPVEDFQIKDKNKSDSTKILQSIPQISKFIRREKQIIQKKVKETEKLVFKGFELPSNIINSPKTDQGGLFQHPEPFNFGPTPLKEGSESPEYLKKNLNFFLSPIEQPGFASPFNIDSNFQTPNMPKHVSQVQTEEAKQKNENIIKKLTEIVFEDLLESFFSTETFIEFTAENLIQKEEKNPKFFINDVSKQEIKVINDLKRQVTIKKCELEEKKKTNKMLTQEFEKTEKEMKKTLEKYEKFRLKYSKYERLIKRSSKHYSQILLPEFEDKEKELSMLGGNRSNLSKILERLKEENLEYSRRLDNKKKSLTDKKNKNCELMDSISKFDEMNQSLRDEIQEIKPKKNDISLKYTWAKYKNELKNKKFKRYEEEIERVQREIKELNEGIGSNKRKTEIETNELDLLENTIKHKIEPRHRRGTNSANTFQESSTKDLTKPEKEEKIQESTQKTVTGGTKEDLINLLAFLIIIFTIIVIFK